MADGQFNPLDPFGEQDTSVAPGAGSTWTPTQPLNASRTPAPTYLSNRVLNNTRERSWETNTPNQPVSAWGYLATVMQSGNFDPGSDNLADKLFTVDEAGSYTIYKGQKPVLILPNNKTGIIGQNDIWTVGELKQNFAGYSVDQRKEWQVLLKKAGFLSSDFFANGQLDPGGEFLNAIGLAASMVSYENFTAFNANGGAAKPMTLAEGINNFIKSGGAKEKVSTHTSVMSFTEGESRATLEKFYADALGRRPSDVEVAKFRAAVNSQAKANADVTTTTTMLGGNTRSVSKEGYSQADAEILARDTSEAQPGAKGFISSTKYMDAFLGSLGGKVGRI